MIMSNFTPQQIVELLHDADKHLDVLAVQFAWFKGQRDHWKDVYDLEFAKAKARQDSRYGANEVALEAISELLYEIPWLADHKVTLLQMVRLTEASFDLIAKGYDRMEKHISILQTVNKNVMLDYQRTGTYD